jgi:hypothetical protein
MYVHQGKIAVVSEIADLMKLFKVLLLLSMAVVVVAAACSCSSPQTWGVGYNPRSLAGYGTTSP